MHTACERARRARTDVMNLSWLGLGLQTHRLPLLFSALIAGCTEPAFERPEDAGYGELAEAGSGAPELEQDGARPLAPSQEGGSEERAEVMVPSPDASSSQASGREQDAGPELLPAADDALLEGRYAVLARFRGTATTSALGSFVEEIVALAEITRVPGEGLRMSWSTCEHRSRIQAPLLPELRSRVQRPDKLPTRTFRVLSSAQGFETQAVPSTVGYEQLTEQSCPPGTLRAQAGRPWLSDGRCLCASSSEPPTDLRDCRVIDSDGDGQPGFTVEFPGFDDAYSRMRDASRMVMGVIASDRRHRANFVGALDTYQLRCPNGPCTRASLSLCSPEQNPVRFLPLQMRADGAPWDCRQIVQELDVTGAFNLDPATGSGC